MARRDADLSIDDLAERIHYQTADIAAMETGKQRVPSLALARISRVVEKPLSWFFEDLPGQDVFDDASEAKDSV